MMRMRIYLFELTDVNEAIFIPVKYLERFPQVRLHVIRPVPDNLDPDPDLCGPHKQVHQMGKFEWIQKSERTEIQNILGRNPKKSGRFPNKFRNKSGKVQEDIHKFQK